MIEGAAIETSGGHNDPLLVRNLKATGIPMLKRFLNTS